jgi:peptidoglycan hydrolase-like protein with peptidoglycan-binding domain
VPRPPPVVPVSPTVELLQQQLAQLDYYDGPINGYLTDSTIQAVEYLQRDAHLPQTGQLDRATQVALDHFLATGNNQMAS